MDRDKLIALVKKESGIKLDVEDPVLAITILNEKILDEALERIEAATQRSVTQIAAAIAQGLAEARQAGGQFVTEASEWSAEHMKLTGMEVAASILNETQGEVTKAEAARVGAVRASWVAIAAAGLAATGVLGWAIGAYLT